ncbi:hypothetical protein ACN4GH_25930, partial [Burkholderia pseudomallei]
SRLSRWPGSSSMPSRRDAIAPFLAALAAFVFLSRVRVHDEPAAEPARSRERRALALDRECG